MVLIVAWLTLLVKTVTSTRQLVKALCWQQKATDSEKLWSKAFGFWFKRFPVTRNATWQSYWSIFQSNTLVKTKTSSDRGVSQISGVESSRGLGRGLHKQRVESRQGRGPWERGGGQRAGPLAGCKLPMAGEGPSGNRVRASSPWRWAGIRRADGFRLVRRSPPGCFHAARHE